MKIIPRDGMLFSDWFELMSVKASVTENCAHVRSPMPARVHEARSDVIQGES